MSENQQADALLANARAGDPAALGQLIEAIYPELKRIARSLLANEPAGHTYGPTGSALVSQLWLRLSASDSAVQSAADARHLLRIAANNMRQILIDHARGKRAQKRPDARNRVSTEHMMRLGEEMGGVSPDEIELGDALQRLSEQYPDSARAVELKYLLGFTNEEGAAVMDKPVIFFRRRCQMGLAWLRQEMGVEQGAANTASPD